MARPLETSEAVADWDGARLIEPEDRSEASGDHSDHGLCAGHGALIARIERVAPAAREEQLARDRDDLLHMQLEGFDGKAWRKKQRELYDYACRVLPKKVRTGEIFAIMRDVGLPPAADLALPKGPRLTTEEVDEVVTMVLARALLDFNRILRDGVWDPYREEVACMSTFFIGKCALMLRGPWRAMLRGRRRRLAQGTPTLFTGEEPIVDHLAQPEAAALTRMAIQTAMTSLPSDEHRTLVWLDACDLKNRTIASQLGLTEKQVEGRLKRARKAMASTRDDGQNVA